VPGSDTVVSLSLRGDLSYIDATRRDTHSARHATFATRRAVDKTYLSPNLPSECSRGEPLTRRANKPLPRRANKPLPRPSIAIDKTYSLAWIAIDS
jgi:hypothetical protein